MPITPDPQTQDPERPLLSVVVPALDEQDNVGPLVDETRAALVDAGVTTQLVIVDDGSTDQTLPRLLELRQANPWLTVLHRDQPQGQSAAMFAGIQAARGQYIATLDADLQNDPADLAQMLKVARDESVDMVQGDRSRNRQDNAVRKITSIIGRKARNWVIGDVVRDTGCSARIVKAEIAKQFPLQYKGMHRFMPAYAAMLGATIREVPVNHRPRVSGQTKYGLGITKRGWSGLMDLLAMRWMIRRYRNTAVTEAAA